jgi:hypothetical protein
VTISTYSELQTAIANWTGRSGLTDRLPEFIALAEKRIINGSDDPEMMSEPLRAAPMIASTTLSTTANVNTIMLPSGFLGFASGLYVDGNPKQPMNCLTLQQITDRYLGSQAGKPRAYALAGRSGTQMIVAPTPDATYSLPVFYYALTLLSVSNTTNAVLTNYPNLYLYAALIEAYIYLRNDERAARFYRLFAGAVNGANNVSDQENFSGSMPQMRSDSGGP